jgi:phosphate/sulfate permease
MCGAAGWAIGANDAANASGHVAGVEHQKFAAGIEGVVMVIV